MKFLRKNFPVLAIALASLYLARPSSGVGAIANVLVGSGGDRFVPAVTNISVNDKVIWTWAGSDHSTTSGTNGVHADDNGAPGGLWDSGVHNPVFSFTNTFTTAGTFSYYCSVHYFEHMTGAVFVAAAALPPDIAITNPISGAVFSAPANVTVQAAVTNGSGAVNNVQFLIGSTVFANVAAAPFSATANNLAAGNYTLTAIASDNNGLTATNSVAISVVTPTAISLAGATRFSGANFQFSYSANVGLNYVVQRSTNLADWESLMTNSAASNPVVFTDLNATNNPNFYRVGRLPNP